MAKLLLFIARGYSCISISTNYCITWFSHMIGSCDNQNHLLDENKNVLYWFLFCPIQNIKLKSKYIAIYILFFINILISKRMTSIKFYQNTGKITMKNALSNNVIDCD